MNVLLTTVLTGCLHPIVSVIVGSEGQPLISTVWLKDKLGLWSLYTALMWQNILIYLSWLDVIINNLFLILGQQVFKQSICIPIGTNSAFVLVNFYRFSYEYNFWISSKSNSCPVYFFSYPSVRRFVHYLLVPSIVNISNYTCLDKGPIGHGIYPESLL